MTVPLIVTALTDRSVNCRFCPVEFFCHRRHGAYLDGNVVHRGAGQVVRTHDACAPRRERIAHHFISMRQALQNKTGFNQTASNLENLSKRVGWLPKEAGTGLSSGGVYLVAFVPTGLHYCNPCPLHSFRSKCQYRVFIS